VRFLVAEPGPAYSVMDTYRGWVEALRETGQHVAEFNLGDRLTFYSNVMQESEQGGTYRYALDSDQAMELAINGLYASILKVRPHVLLLISAFFVPTDLMEIARAAGVKVVVAHTECPYEDDRQIKVAEHADLNLVDDPTNLDRFQAAARSEYFPKAYRPSLHKPGTVPRDLDFSFVGTGYPSRMRFLEAMNLDGLSVALGGNWAGLRPDSPLHQHLLADPAECMDNDKTVQLYHRTKVGLNLYRQESEDGSVDIPGWSMGPRELELAATGTFFLRDPRPESDEVLHMLPTVAGPEDASEQLRWWLAHEDERQEAAEKARAAVADRTFENHARRLMRLLEEE
jgi:spore maturation protein CgeB